MERINIHLRFDSKSRQRITKINQDLNVISQSDIIFGTRFGAIPHITLAIGHIDNIFLEKISACLHTLSDEVRTFYPLFKLPQFGDRDEHYIICNITNTQLLAGIRARLGVCLSELPNKTMVVEENPHLTLGFFEKINPALISYITNTTQDMKYTCDTLAISTAGNKGVCKDTIASFKLRPAD